MSDYQLITNKLDLFNFIKACKRDSSQTALDFETTALRPEDGRVRLVSLCNDHHRAVVDFDRIRWGFRLVAHYFSDHRWVVFNTGFEMRWFLDAGEQPDLIDVQHMRKSIVGGSNLSLALMAKWDLGVELDKTQQAGDWGRKKLTQEQLDYAFADAKVTWDLWTKWCGEADEGTLRCFELLNQLELPVIEMEEAGMKIDTKRHMKLVKEWEKLRDEKVALIREMVGEDEVANINSDKQWSNFFAQLLPDDVLRHWPRTEKTGQLEMSSQQLRRMAGAFPGTPLETTFDALADYKKVAKYLSSFGQTLITRTEMSPDGRIHARFNIGAARTLRFSCSSPNLQQIPNDQEDWFGQRMSVRQSFIETAPDWLVSLDYSGIELRVLALESGDDQMLRDLIEGDIHAEVGAEMVGRRLDLTKAEDKEIRRKAKGVSFGIIYGSSAAGLSLTLRTSMGRAQEMLEFWEGRYPRAFQFRYDRYDEAMETGKLRMRDGGTIHMGKRPDLPKCANYPIQRAAWHVMARAIIRHHDSLRELRSMYRGRRIQMLSTIHDALIDRCHYQLRKTVLRAMRDDMTAAYLDVFPGAPTDRLLEGGVGRSWGTLREVSLK